MLVWMAVVGGFPGPDSLVGSHPVHETAVQKERSEELVFAEVCCACGQSGLVWMGTGVVVYAAETS